MKRPRCAKGYGDPGRARPGRPCTRRNDAGDRFAATREIRPDPGGVTPGHSARTGQSRTRYRIPGRIADSCLMRPAVLRGTGTRSRRCHERRSPLGFRGGSVFLPADDYHAKDPAKTCLQGHYLPKLSNSPFRARPRNACHSSGVNRRIAASASLLLRTPISPPGRLAISTQFPLAKLRELLTHLRPESRLLG